ncbi:MAG: hypothetical protein KatS3mg102_0141 [Planctomycetota bacterium]|nr:MAG: hypothetical protein KatS3mg102_0141 [Planctomycetota bacterium]
MIQRVLGWLLALGLEAVAVALFALDPAAWGMALVLHLGSALATVRASYRPRAAGGLGGGPAAAGGAFAALVPVAGLLAALLLDMVLARAPRGRAMLELLEQELHGRAGPRVLEPPRADPAEALRDAVDVEPLVDALRYGDSALRRGAVERLAARGGRDAIRALRAALTDPDGEVRVLALGALAAIEDRLARAIHAAQEEVRRQPAQPSAHAALGRQYMEYCYLGLLEGRTRQQYLELAVQSFARALELGRARDPELLLVMGRALLDLGQHERGLGFLHRAVEAAPHDGRLYLWRAEGLLRVGQLELVPHDCRRALERGVSGPAWEAAAFWAEVLARPEAAPTAAAPRPPVGFVTPPSGLHRVVLPASVTEADRPLGGEALRRTLARLLEGLASASPARRAEAYRALLRHRSEEAVAEVWRQAAAAEEVVRAFVCRYLSQVGGPTAAAALVAMLEAPEDAVREEAALALERLGPADKVEPLLAALGPGGGRHARLYACRALGQLGLERAVLPLVELLRDPLAEVRREAADALRRLRDPRAVRPLIPLLADPAEPVRYTAAYTLGELGAGPAVRALGRAALGDPSPRVRQVAVWALGRARGRAALAVLARALALDPSPPVRLEAARRLGRQQRPAAVGELLRAYARDPEPEVRLAAAHALDALPDRIAVPALVRALRAIDPRQRHAAAIELGHRGGPRAVRALSRTLAREPDPIVRAAAAEALGTIGEAASLPVLEAALASPSVPVVYAAALALAAVLGARGLEAVADFVARSPALRLLPPAGQLALLQTVHRIGADRPLPEPLAELARRALHNPSPNLTYAAALVLGRSRRAQDVAPLLELAATSGLAEVRAAALEAAGALAATHPQALLAELEPAPGRTPAVRRAALLALVRVRLMPDELVPLLARALAHMPELRAQGLSQAEQDELVRSLGRRLGALLPRLLASEDPVVAAEGARVLRRAAELGALAIPEADASQALAALAALLQHPAAATRAAAAAALGALRASEAVAELVRAALDDPAGEVRTAARRALAGWWRPGRGSERAAA